jgi:hypothetical protein
VDGFRDVGRPDVVEGLKVGDRAGDPGGAMGAPRGQVQ